MSEAPLGRPPAGVGADARSGAMKRGLIVTFAVHFGLVGAALAAHAFDGDASQRFVVSDKNVNVIEAGLAVRKKQKRGRKSRLVRKQQQKRLDPQTLGVSNNAQGAAAKDKPEKPEDVFNRFRNVDLEPDKAGDEGSEDEGVEGADDGSEWGTLENAKGDPYVGELIGRMTKDFVVPTVVRQKSLAAYGCVRLSPAGKVVERSVPEENKSHNRTFDRAVEERLKLTSDMEQPVPAHLVDLLVKAGACAIYKSAD